MEYQLAAMNGEFENKLLEQALQSCADEKVHLMHQMQGDCYLMSVHKQSGKIAFYSQNINELSGDILEIKAGKNIKDVLDGIDWAHTQACFPDESEPTAPVSRDIKFIGCEVVHECWVHRNGDMITFEFCQNPKQADEIVFQNSDFSELMMQVSNAEDIAGCFDVLVKEIARITGFDRVMVYQFDDEANGEVVAECASFAESYLGLRYPASDIPAQARELFKKNGVRIFRDVDADFSEIAPPQTELTGIPLDLSLSTFRQPSAVHVQYLKNMGVRSSMTLAVLVKNQLWGLVACHHAQPIQLTYSSWKNLLQLSAVIGAQVRLFEQRDEMAVQLACSEVANKVIQSITVHHEWVESLLEMSGNILDRLEVQGMTVFYEGETHSCGSVPSPEVMQAIGHKMLEHPSKVFSTDQWNQALPDLPYDPAVCGVLGARLSSIKPNFILFFRPEQRQEVRWAGEPNKELKKENGRVRLDPRNSFTEWVEETSGRSIPWQQAEIQMVETIGDTLTDIVLTAYYARKEVMDRELIRLRQALEGNQDPICLFDEMGEVLFSNEAFTELFIEAPTSVDEFEEYALEKGMRAGVCRQVIATQQPQTVEIVTPTGALFARLEPVLGKENQVVGLYFSAH